MDEKKQPGIKVESILLAESVFRRMPHIPEALPVNVVFDIKNMISGNSILVTEVKATLNKPEDPVYGVFHFVGQFSCEECENMSLDEFAKNSNSAAIIFPYIREEIHSRSIKAGLPQIIINPVNLKAIIDEKSGK